MDMDNPFVQGYLHVGHRHDPWVVATVETGKTCLEQVVLGDEIH